MAKKSKRQAEYEKIQRQKERAQKRSAYGNYDGDDFDELEERLAHRHSYTKANAKGKIKLGYIPQYNSPRSLAAVLEEYLNDTKPGNWTKAGLGRAAGIPPRELEKLADSEDMNWAIVVQQALSAIEEQYELSLRANGRAGDMFAMKQFKWSDKQEIHNTHAIQKMGEVAVEDASGKREALDFAVGEDIETDEDEAGEIKKYMTGGNDDE